MLRITGGQWKGRTFIWPTDIRPTSEKVRQAICNIVADRLPGAVVLDLFAGSGALGLEALSRGAAHVVFVEERRQSLQVLRQNLARLAVGAAAGRIIGREALTALRQLEREGRRFTLVLLDPPYGRGWGKKCLQALGRHAILSDGSLVLLEHHHRDIVLEAVASLQRIGVYEYGDTTVSCYQARLPAP